MTTLIAQMYHARMLGVFVRDACCQRLRDEYRAGSCEPGVQADAAYLNAGEYRVGQVVDVSWRISGCDGSTDGVRYCPWCGAALPMTAIVIPGEPADD